MRSHVVFKFLNSVTDKIVRVVTYVKVCVNYMCVCEGETERERVGYVLSVHIKTSFCNFDRQDLSISSFSLLYVFVWPVSLWVLVIFLL